MRPVWIRARTDLLARWRSWAALALIVGVFGGIVVAAAAGARRTDSAYPDFLGSQHSYQQFMFTVAFEPGTAAISPEQIASLPEVQTVVRGFVFDGVPQVTMRGSTDARLDRSLNEANILAGRLPEAANEFLVPELLAKAEHLHVGSALPFTLVTQDPHAAPIHIDGRVVGIGVAPGEFPPDNDIGTGRWVHVSPAFVRAYAKAGAPFAYVFLKHGDADLASFQAGLTRLAKGLPVIGYQQASLTKNVIRAFHLQAISLWLLALLLGVTVLALVAQTVSRVTWIEARDHPVLSAIGMTRAQLFGVALVRVGVTAVISVVIATALAYGLSPLAPTGLARTAVVHPGFAFD